MPRLFSHVRSHENGFIADCRDVRVALKTLTEIHVAAPNINIRIPSVDSDPTKSLTDTDGGGSREKKLSSNQTLAFSRWGRGHVLPLPRSGSEGSDFSLTFTVLLIKVIRTLLPIDTQPVGPGAKRPSAASIIVSAAWTARGTRWNPESVCPESFVKNRNHLKL